MNESEKEGLQMRALIEDFIREIKAAGFVATITGDNRGISPGGAVTIEVTRPNCESKNSGHLTTLLLRTIPPTSIVGQDTPGLYGITDLAVDGAAGIRVRHGVTAQELWRRIFDLLQEQRATAARSANSRIPQQVIPFDRSATAKDLAAEAPSEVFAPQVYESRSKRKRRARKRRRENRARENAERETKSNVRAA